jgi:hypothetical protein
MRVESVGEVMGGDPGMFGMHDWAPEGESTEDLFFLSLDAKDFRYLWFEKITGSVRSRQSSNVEAYPGDVWLVVMAEPRLIFMGPETKPDKYHVLADWEVFLAETPPAVIQLYQPGPARKHKGSGVKSVYEHLREPSI